MAAPRRAPAAPTPEIIPLRAPEVGAVPVHPETVTPDAPGTPPAREAPPAPDPAPPAGPAGIP